VTSRHRSHQSAPRPGADPPDPVTVPGTTSLTLDGRPVADYRWRPSLPASVSPRPFLHPVRTLAGTEVTELMPTDHLHHLGVSIAVADVGGVNFWGGRTFLPHRGPVHLPNHGTQRHHGWTTRTATTLTHDLRWTGPDGRDLLHERRRIRALPVSERAWALDLAFELTNVTGAPLAFASPATNGRPGAGYGGFFWRARLGDRRVAVLGPEGNGERQLHGRRTPWVALTGGNAAPWTLVFVTGGSGATPDPWFVRSRDYVGVGSALAWSQPLVVEQGAGLGRRIMTVVVDGRLRSPEVSGIVDTVAAVLAGPG
jgi:hypothetical protein